jgi:hypothetical protein
LTNNQWSGGERIFADSAIHSVHIPSFIAGEGTPENPWRSDEEMFSPGPSCWQKQRQAVTSIPNLMLAGTLVRTTLGSENMDSANESGKHAAQRSDKRQVSRYHLFRLVPRAIQHSCDDYTLSMTVALRPVTQHLRCILSAAPRRNA